MFSVCLQPPNRLSPRVCSSLEARWCEHKQDIRVRHFHPLSKCVRLPVAVAPGRSSPARTPAVRWSAATPRSRSPCPTRSARSFPMLMNSHSSPKMMKSNSSTKFASFGVETLIKRKFEKQGYAKNVDFDLVTDTS